MGARPHQELREVIVEGLMHERPSFTAGLEALDSLFEQFEALTEAITTADRYTQQPVDLNYVALLKDDWQRIVARVSSPASRSSDG